MAGNPLKLIGKKHVDILSLWVGSALAYGTATGVGITYFTDWKAVLQYVPYYSGKFPVEEK